MKKFFSIISLVLCLSIVFGAIPVYAESGKFVTLRVIQSNNGEKKAVDDVAYKNGGSLYVSTNFLTAYTPYVFDNETSSFYRLNHEPNSKYGTVVIDVEQKAATLYMNPFSHKEYALRDVYEFGGQLFLPLDQLAALLKAEVFEETDEDGNGAISIACCLNSLCDAEYALSKIMKMKYVYYGYSEMVDDIFSGDQVSFYASSVLGYFSSTIFGKRLTNLDVAFHSGDYQYYKSLLTKCVTDNDDFYDKMATSEPLLYRLNLAMNLNSAANTGAASYGKFFSYIEKMTDTGAMYSPDTAEVYFLSRDHAAMFSAIADVTEAMDYVLKFASMTQDNKDMLNNYAKYMDSSTKDYDPLYSAVKTIREKYGDDFVTSVVKSIVEKVAETYLKNNSTIKAAGKAIGAQASKALGGNVALVSIAIDVINATCKYAGIDLKDNTNYSIMKDFEVKSSLGKYVDSFGDNHHRNKNQAEKYRLAVIFWLLSSKHTFAEANKLCKKYGMSSSYYNDRIETVSYVLGLYYLAAQGTAFDSFAAVNNIIDKNSSVTKNSEKICGDEISQDDALNHKYISGFQTEAWKAAAEDAIYNYYDINPDMNYNDVFSFFLIDIDNDSIPEIFQCVEGGTAQITFQDFLYWNGSKFVLGDMSNVNNCIWRPYPYKNNETSETEFWIQALPTNLQKVIDYERIYMYGTSYRIQLENGALSYSETVDRTQYTDVRSSSGASEEEKAAASQKLMEEKDDFYKKYTPIDDYIYNYAGFSSMYFINEGRSSSSYRKTVSKADAKEIVEDYCNNVHHS